MNCNVLNSKFSKIFIIALMIFAVLFSLGGCSENNKTKDNKNAKNTSLEKVTKSDSKSAKSTTEPTTEKFNPSLTESDAVSDKYFDDCVFIGDSITEGISFYEIMDNATVLSHSGLNVINANTKSYNFLNGNMTIAQAVAGLKPKYIYIMLGSNDVGWMPEKQFISNYDNLVKAVKNASPKSIVILESILPVTESYTSKKPDTTNAKIDLYNSDIIKIASDNKCYYLNVAQDFKNSSNALPEEISEDGMHIKKAGYMKWFDYIKTHTVRK